MTDIDTLIERLHTLKRDIEESAFSMSIQPIDNAIAALRAVQWRPIAEAPKDPELTVNCGFVDGRMKSLMLVDIGTPMERWVDGHGNTHYPDYCFKLPPLPTPRASKEG